MGLECGLVDVSFMDMDLMVTRSEIYLREHDGSIKAVQQLINAWQWVSVFNCLFIYGMIIY